MLNRVLALLGYPAHIVNRQLDGLLARLGLSRVPGALLVGLFIGAMAISTALSTIAAFDARPEPEEISLTQLALGRIASGAWIEFDARPLDGPHRATVQVAQGGRESIAVERVHYLVVDPDAPDHGTIVRFREPIPELESGAEVVHLDGTITEDSFNMRSLLEGWDLAARHPDVQFSDTRLLAYDFETPFREPSWTAAIVLGIVAAVLLAGAFVPYPIFRPGRREPAPAHATPIPLEVHGSLPTPRGPVVLRGTPATLERMDMAEVARMRWRYWGAGLGDVRRDVEEAVRRHGHATDQLVVHGPTGSVIWPIEPGARLDLESGDAFIGRRRRPALRVRGDDVAASLTFERAGDRDAAMAVLEGG